MKLYEHLKFTDFHIVIYFLFFGFYLNFYNVF